MPISPESITDETSTVPANSEEAPKDTSVLPEEILAMPIFKGILEGAPAALYTTTGDKSPEAVTAVKNGKSLNEAGIYFYRDDKSKTDLIYNSRFVSEDLLKAALKKGKISEVASPLAETVAAFNGTTAPAAGGEAPVSAGGVPSPVPVDSALNTARVGNLSPGGPTSGPQPGGGRVLNQILTPTV